MTRSDIRLALPSKGRLYEDSLEFLEACGLRIYRPNPRQYAATIPSLPALTVMFQRPGDLVAGDPEPLEVQEDHVQVQRRAGRGCCPREPRPCCPSLRAG